MHVIRSLYIISVVFWIMLCSGCGDSGWTEYYNVNLSEQKLKVTIVGFSPDASPGALMPGAGTSQLKEKTQHIAGEPITIDETITISWTIEGSSVMNSVKLKRDDMGIPAQVRGGRITFTYTADGEWNIKYSR